MGRKEGAKSFLRAARIFKTVPNILFRGGKMFSKGISTPLVTGLLPRHASQLCATSKFLLSSTTDLLAKLSTVDDHSSQMQGGFTSLRTHHVRQQLSASFNLSRLSPEPTGSGQSANLCPERKLRANHQAERSASRLDKQGNPLIREHVQAAPLSW